MPIKISPASDDALGIAFGKRKAQAIVRKQREDDEFKRTLRKVFYLPNGAQVTLNARGGTIHVQAVSSLISSSSPWFAYGATYSHLKWYMLRDVDHIVYMPSRRFESGVYEYAAFSSAEMAAIRALRDLSHPERLKHIANIRTDIATEFNAEWLLGSVLSGLPHPSSEVIAPYFVMKTDEYITSDSGSGSNTHHVDYTVFDGVDAVFSGTGSFTEAFDSYGGYLSFTSWPSCMTTNFLELFGGSLPVSSSEVIDGFIVSGNAYFYHNNTSGPLFTSSLAYSRIDAVTTWLNDKSTIIDQSLTWYGSTGDKAVQPGSIVHVFCLEYHVNENWSSDTYWTPFIELCDREYTVDMPPNDTYDVFHPGMDLTPEDQTIIETEKVWRPALATAVRVLRHFAKKLTRKPGGLADREWVNATLSSGKSFINGETVIGTFAPITPWGLPEMIVLIENPNGSFRPAGNDYANAVNQTYVEKTPHTEDWLQATTTDEIRAMIMSEVLSRSGFV